MKGAGGIPEHAAKLYREAEEKVALRSAPDEALLMELDARRLLHELQVHKVELEMQNVELQRVTLAQELLLEEYKDLYDFAPVGYLSLNREGRILKSNLAGALLLGLSRSQIDRQPLARFVARQDHPLLASYLQEVFQQLAGKTTCELKLVTEGRATIFAQLEARASGSSRQCLVALTDVTKLRHEEQKLQVVAHSLEDSCDALEALSAELNLSEERERRRIALALHDRVVQSLAMGRMNLESALDKGEIADHPVLRELRGMLGESMLELRDLSRDLSPPILYDLGLRAAIASLGDRFGEKYGFRFVFPSPAAPEEPPGENLAISIFQFCRELLMNVVKHAGAATVTASLRQKGDRLVLQIADDGMGFDAAGHQEGFGLANIRQRVNYLRGDFTIESSPGAGTRCEISLDRSGSGQLERGRSNGDTRTACR